jgi:DNA-binding transcriptional ArsR family regulator
VLERRTNAYKAWVRRITEEHDIPVVAAPSGVRKEELVEPYYRRWNGAEGVACVLTSLEQSRTFVSYVPKSKPESGDAKYRLIKACHKRFLHYCWYVLDPVMGAMSVRVASYFPFNVTCYLNGHAFVAQELTRAGVRFRTADNAFVGVADVAALQAAADRLTPALLQRRCAYWVRQLVPMFSPAERAALAPGYRYSMAQMELATDVRFKRSAPLKALFQRAGELGVLVGGAERTTHLFGRRINRRYRGKLQTVLDQRDAGHPVLRWYSQTSFAKQYTRGDDHADRILRTETCSNDTYHFGIGRRLENLPLLRQRLATTNERCLALQAELLTSAVDAGHLTVLAAPTLVGQRRVPGLKLHDDRVIRLLDALLQPAGFVTNWTTRELHARILTRPHLTETDYRLSQLRYDLAKLRANGLVERLGRTRRYQLTPLGLKLGVVLVKLRIRLLGPLATLVTTSVPRRQRPPTNSVDTAFLEVDTALDHLTAGLGLTTAA